MNETARLDEFRQAEEAVGRRRRKRSVAIKLGLGALALIGIGAGVTSAAWSDNANFVANGNSASVDLRGSGDGTTYVTADGGTDVVDLTSSVGAGSFSNMLPGAVVTRTVYLWNYGTVPLALTWTTPTTVLGATCDSVTYGAKPTTIPASGKIQVLVTYTLLSTAPQATCQGRTVSLAVTVSGATS